MRSLSLILLLMTTATIAAQDFLDRLDEMVTLSAFDGNFRTRLSGTLDLEYYAFPQPPPGLIDASGHNLFNPRLTLFLDAQIGPQFYFFSQLRVDRHFDPSDRGAQVRLDEYALRFTPYEDGRVSLQLGKFATVFGHWVERHLSWDNAFVTAPLVYENTLPLEDRSAPHPPFTGHREDEKRDYFPEIWGPSYASGVSISGALGKFEYAFEVKNAALSSRPESWEVTQQNFDHPTVNGRVGLKPSADWNLGLSASTGSYFQSEAQGTLPAGRSIGDYQETVLAQDISYEHHHLQIFAEFHEAQFDLPRLGTGRTFGYFLEVRYQFLPQLFGAVRWNQQLFNDVGDGLGRSVNFAPDISRLEVAGTYRPTAHTQVKLEYYLETEQDRDPQHNFAAQFTIRF